MARKIIPLTARKKKASPKALTLADVTIQWQEGQDTRELSGRDVAWLVQYARERHPYADSPLFNAESLRVISTLRGLSGILFPDAGSPHPSLEADERFSVSEILRELAATVGADAMGGEGARRFQIVPVKR